jgi:hypothetical protein
VRYSDFFQNYTITKDGFIYSKKTGRVIKSHLTNAGYLGCELWFKGRYKKALVHRVVAIKYIENPKGKPQVNHINGIKTDNRVSNLEWVTRSENQIHAYKTGLQKGFRVGGHKLSCAHKKALCGSRWAGQKRRYVCDGLIFQKPEEAASYFKLSRQTIYNRASSKNWPTWRIDIWQEVK